MLFERFDGKVKPHWCQHIDLIGKRELTEWFKVQEEGIEEDWEQAHSFDSTPEDVEECRKEREELQRWKKEFIRLGFIFK